MLSFVTSHSLMDLLGFGATESSPDETSRQAVIALGGGGARGVAHLGVMEVIGESGIHTEQIVGVSMGSLVGALCAADPNIQRVQTKAIEFLNSPIFQRKQNSLAQPYTPVSGHRGLSGSWFSRMKKALAQHQAFLRVANRSSLMPGELLGQAIDYLLPDVNIEDLSTPFSVVAADLYSGHRIVLETGPIREAVRASMSIPGVFPPVPWKDMLLCDIGVIDSLALSVARSYGSDMTIAVDVGQHSNRINKCETALDVLMRMEDMSERLMRSRAVLDADLLIRPDVGDVSWFDFSNCERLIESGRRAARKSLGATLGKRMELKSP